MRAVRSLLGATLTIRLRLNLPHTRAVEDTGRFAEHFELDAPVDVVLVVAVETEGFAHLLASLSIAFNQQWASKSWSGRTSTATRSFFEERLELLLIYYPWKDILNIGSKKSSKHY